MLRLIVMFDLLDNLFVRFWRIRDSAAEWSAKAEAASSLPAV